MSTKTHNLVYKWLKYAQHSIRSQCCFFCMQRVVPGFMFCSPCLISLPWITYNSCKNCGLELKTTDSEVCGACLQKALNYVTVTAVFTYTDLIAYCIKRLKFHADFTITTALVPLFTARLAVQLASSNAVPEVIIPAPLHKRRLRARGYNQVIEMAKSVGRLLNINIDRHTCLRVKNTSAQAKLAKKARLKNIKNAFRVKEHNYSHVAIMDDVLTTGATVHALAQALHKQGVEQVDVWVLARVEI